MQLPVCGPGIVEYHALENVSNIKDVDNDAVTTTLPQEPIDHESQIFVWTCNRTIVLNVNLASDSVEGVKRLIEEREGIPVTEQHLIFGGKPLRHGTFLRDYDALGHQCTLNAFARIRGGNRTRDMTLSSLMDEGNPPPEELPPTWNLSNPGVLTQDQRIPMLLGDVNVPVLTEVGGRILHGVLTCILIVHRAGLSFNGAFGTGNLWVHGYKGAENELVVSRIYVGSEIEPTPRLDDDACWQKEDYRALKKVIRALFPGDDGLKTLHVGSIYNLLDSLAADRPKTKGLVDPVKRTHLLQAYAAMVSSPVAVSTMCLNLKRFYDQLDDASQRRSFEQAMDTAQQGTYRLPDEVKGQPLFKRVYEFVPPNQNVGSVPNNLYAAYNTGMELFNFARNWFTHVPTELRDNKPEQFEGLPHLDYIFTYHFANFIPEALLHLYTNFIGDHNLLTRVLVPIA